MRAVASKDLVKIGKETTMREKYRIEDIQGNLLNTDKVQKLEMR